MGSGLFFAPTIFDNVVPDSRLAQNEVFGPVLAITPFDTEAEVRYPYICVSISNTKRLNDAFHIQFDIVLRRLSPLRTSRSTAYEGMSGPTTCSGRCT